MAYQILSPERGGPEDIHGILFDLDGVILDSEKLYARFWAAACAFYGFPMTYIQSLGMRSLSAEAGQAYLSSLFGSSICYAEVKAKRIEMMDAYVKENGIEAKPGIYRLLDYLDDTKIPRAITTASPAQRTEEYLHKVGLSGRFDKICSAHEVAHGKPEPDIYLFGAAALNLTPENCLALEDSYTGILSAARAGCKAVIIPDLDEPGENILSSAWGRADSLEDIITMLENR